MADFPQHEDDMTTETESDGLLESAMAEYAEKNFDRVAAECAALRTRAETAECERDAALADRNDIAEENEVCHSLLDDALGLADGETTSAETLSERLPKLIAERDAALAQVAALLAWLRQPDIYTQLPTDTFVTALAEHAARVRRPLVDALNSLADALPQGDLKDIALRALAAQDAKGAR